LNQAIRKISDLPLPVQAAKADWLVASHWLGFTPAGNSRNARAQCTSAIARQSAGGFVIEYITALFGEPNQGFENDPEYIEERAAHKDVAGRLIAVHRLRPSSRPAIEILGHEEFNHLQDMWSKDGQRCRWSVAFPIIETYQIPTRPLASEVLGTNAMKRLFAHQSATLRPLNDDERKLIADLPLERSESKNAWIGIEDEIEMAELSEIPIRTQELISEDLAAIEGESAERSNKIRLRAAWLANRFIADRMRAGLLKCDECGFDAMNKVVGTRIKPRSLLDVHHMNPLAEGKRYTTVSDFALLCPTCHRYVHALLQAN